MEIEGRLWKSGKFWLVEVPAIEVMSQGHTQKEALAMIADAIEGLIECYYPEESEGFKVFVHEYKKGVIGINTTHNSLMLAFSLKRLREASKSTVREVSERLGSRSPNAYSRYERGRTRISLEHYERLLQAVNPEQNFHLRVV